MAPYGNRRPLVHTKPLVVEQLIGESSPLRVELQQSPKMKYQEYAFFEYFDQLRRMKTVP